MQAELEALDRGLGNPEKPVVAIVGGAKVSTKLDLLMNLVRKVDAPYQYKISFGIFGFHQFPELGKFGFADLRCIAEGRIVGFTLYQFVPESRIIPGDQGTTLQHIQAHRP